MKNKLITMATLIIASASTGCSVLETQVPKCSDQETLGLVRQIIAESVGATGENSISAATLKSALTIELPHATSLEENIKKYSCEATLQITDATGTRSKIVINYTSQLDDDNQHLVHAGGMSQFDQYFVANALKAALKAETQPTPDIQSTTAASTTNVDPATDAAIKSNENQSQDSTEFVENTPNEVADNEAIRNKIFNGTGESGTPKFTDYPVDGIYSGPIAALDKSTEEARTFRTRLSEALAQGPIDFAGEYTSAGWGCGTMCSYTTFINRRTGQIIKQGLGGELGPKAVKFLPNSEMLIAEGGEVDDNYNSTGNYAFFYRLSNGELQLIAKVPVPEEIY